MAWDPREPLHVRSEVDQERDDLELHVTREAWRLGLPVLGICRGEQMLNVALGGSLIQDVPEHFGCPADLHRHGRAEDPEVRHSVDLAPESRLAAILGAVTVGVNSRHHQAVRRLAPELRAAAWHWETAREGGALVEAVEAADPARWAFGVQWHPENLVSMEDGAGAAARRLFEAFVAEVRARS